MKNISVLCAAAAVLVSIATAMAENEKPVIINQPTSVKAKVGDSVTFTVGAVDVNTKDKKSFTTSILGKVDLDMIYCPPGTFMMGSPVTEMGHQDNETLHRVTLTKGFWMGKYEVTQALYKAVMGNIPEDGTFYFDDVGRKSYGLGDNYPVYNISWDDANSFCDRLTQIERAAGSITEEYKYTLPTEAQWEYVCRAGTTTALNSGKNLLTAWLDTDPNVDEVAWYNGNRNGLFHEIGKKLPNAWGFYDMHGNAAEWCLDLYVEDLGADAVTNPYNRESSYPPVIRGNGALQCYWNGGYYAWEWEYDSVLTCRSAWRSGRSLDYAGFRVALVPVEE